MFEALIITAAFIALIFAYYLMALEIRDMNSRIKRIKNDITLINRQIANLWNADMNKEQHPSIQEFSDLKADLAVEAKTRSDETRLLLAKLPELANDLARVKIELRKMNDKSVFDKGGETNVA